MTQPLETATGNALSLSAQIDNPDNENSTPNDEAWIEVIQQMDRFYAELVESQVALEEKNEQLETAQEFISGVMRAMTDLMIVCDTQGQIEQVNDALVQLTEVPADQLIGRALSSVLTGDTENSQAEFQTRIAANEPFFDCEVQVLGAHGESLSLSVNCSPRYDRKNRPIGMVLIGRPMGELQRAYRELNDALQNFETAQQHLVSSEKMAALGRLVAGVAHELNNPISFVFGNMYALKSYGEKITQFLQATQNPLSDVDIQRLRDELQIDRIAKDILPLVEGTLEGAERVSDIVQDLRRFSGNQKESYEEFSLYPVLQTAVNWVLRGVKDTPEVNVDCPLDVRVKSKKGHIHQIAVNLVQNAVDALGQSGRRVVDVSVEQNEQQTSILVKDSGLGIKIKDMDKIFEPFFTTKPIGKGTGLGLYVSYRMAEEIGGKLSVEEDVGTGACFKLTLPDTPLEVEI